MKLLWKIEIIKYPKEKHAYVKYYYKGRYSHTGCVSSTDKEIDHYLLIRMLHKEIFVSTDEERILPDWVYIL